MKRILLLGGVTEALAIARTLGPEHIYSLAGVGRVPTDLTCQVRVGGYGGAEGLAQFIRDEGIELVLDATHPYAAQISANAARAAGVCGIPCWALRRPAWQPQADDDWREVGDWAELIEALKPFKRPLFTLGREPLQHLDEIPAEQFWTLRALDVYPGNERCEVIGARGPFLIEDERALFERRQIDVLISKNSGILLEARFKILGHIFRSLEVFRYVEVCKFSHGLLLFFKVCCNLLSALDIAFLR